MKLSTALLALGGAAALASVTEIEVKALRAESCAEAAAAPAAE